MYGLSQGNENPGGHQTIEVYIPLYVNKGKGAWGLLGGGQARKERGAVFPVSVSSQLPLAQKNP